MVRNPNRISRAVRSLSPSTVPDTYMALSSRLYDYPATVSSQCLSVGYSWKIGIPTTSACTRDFQLARALWLELESDGHNLLLKGEICTKSDHITTRFIRLYSLRLPHTIPLQLYLVLQYYRLTANWICYRISFRTYRDERKMSFSSAGQTDAVADLTWREPLLRTKRALRCQSETSKFIGHVYANFPSAVQCKTPVVPMLIFLPISRLVLIRV